MGEVRRYEISVLSNQITLRNNCEVSKLYNQRFDKLEIHVRMYGFKIVIRLKGV